VATDIFAAQVSAWARETEQRLTAVMRDSAQTLVEEVKTPVAKGGHMRVDTGFLRASLHGSKSSMPSIDKAARPDVGGTYPDDNQVELVIAGAKLTDVLYLGFTASYAGIREYHDGFVKLAAQHWPVIVKQSAVKIQTKVINRSGG
jgi:hypothetical protein